MTVIAVPSGHFQGGRALTHDPTTGSDVRSLEDVANEIISDLNAASAGLATIADDHVTAHITGLDIKVDEENQSAALNGDALKTFVPTHLVLKTVIATAPLNADGTINVGTAADGTQIASGVALTGLTTVGAARVVPLTANTSAVAANATLHANVESAESGGGTLELDVYVIGRQV